MRVEGLGLRVEGRGLMVEGLQNSSMKGRIFDAYAMHSAALTT